MTTERYLRLIGGAFVAASVALGYFINPWWFAFTAFVGLNLFQSAFTNWCPMVWILHHLDVNDDPSQAHAEWRGQAAE